MNKNESLTILETKIFISPKFGLMENLNIQKYLLIGFPLKKHITLSVLNKNDENKTIREYATFIYNVISDFNLDHERFFEPSVFKTLRVYVRSEESTAKQFSTFLNEILLKYF